MHDAGDSRDCLDVEDGCRWHSVAGRQGEGVTECRNY